MGECAPRPPPPCAPLLLQRDAPSLMRALTPTSGTGRLCSRDPRSILPESNPMYMLLLKALNVIRLRCTLGDRQRLKSPHGHASHGHFSCALLCASACLFLCLFGMRMCLCQLAVTAYAILTPMCTCVPQLMSDAVFLTRPQTGAALPPDHRAAGTLRPESPHHATPGCDAVRRGLARV